jgi:hypothetical protein
VSVDNERSEMTIEIRDNQSLSVLPLPREKVPAKAVATNVSTQDAHGNIVQVNNIGPETEAYSEPGSVIDIYV